MHRWTGIVATWGTLCVLLAGVQPGPVWAAASPERVLGPCEGCEAAFEGLPPMLSSAARIATPDEPGEPMPITGTVYHPDGRPAAGIIVYAYHTNSAGIYLRDNRWGGWAARHGRLRGWAKTDLLGRYRFDTIRPGAYPGTDALAHVYMHVLEPGCCTYYIDDIHFEDDPRINERRRASLRMGRGGSGLVEPRRAPPPSLALRIQSGWFT